ncbi:MAG: addiction module protein [Planctomycetes bacterium]|nr:addiction module protein [Planctomycetota bacterium]
MPHTVDPKVYLKLSPEERVKLMDEIYQSLVDEGAESAVPGPDIDELRRRIAQHQKDPGSAIAWDEARKRLGWK